MTTYNTGNPVPSADARDRFDNSQTFDELITGTNLTTVNRLNKPLTTWAGFNEKFNQFLINSGFEPTHLVYVDGSSLQVDRPTQLIDRAPSVYRVKTPAAFPVTLSGNWATDSALLVDVGDASLRQALASPAPGEGQAMISRGIQVATNLAEALDIPHGLPGAIVLVLGNKDPDDGGGGHYRIDVDDTSTPANGVTVHALTHGGRLKLIHDGRINIKQAGAVGDDVNDDTASIQAALSLGSVQVYAPPPKVAYKITSTLLVGNGTASAVSTINGIELHGLGAGITPSEFGPSGGSVTFRWHGPSGGVMMQIMGPIYGVNLSGFVLDCNGLASTGIKSKHLCASTWTEILVRGYTGDAYIWGAYRLPTAMAVGASDCTFTNVSAKYPGSGGCGAHFGEYSGPNGILDVARCVWSMCEFWRDGTSVVSYCMKFEYIDNCTFVECHNHAQGATGGVGIFVLPYADNTAFPGAITFINCPILGGVSANAAWTADEGFLFWPYPVGDGQPVPESTLPKQVYGITTRGDYFGGLSIGVQGTPITKHVSVQAALVFGTVPGSSSTERAVNVPGVVIGDSVSATTASSSSQPASGVLTAYVSSPGVVAVKWTNVSSSPLVVPDWGYRVDAWKH